MHFRILLCHVSMHCLKDSSVMANQVGCHGALAKPHAFKTGFLDDNLDPGERNHT